LPETESIIVGKAFKDDIFRYISEENDWIEIEMFSGDARYIHRSLVEIFTHGVSAPFSNDICLKLIERLEEAKERSLTESDVKSQNVLFDRYILDIFHEFGLQPVVFEIAVNRCSEGPESKIGQRPSEMIKTGYTLGAPIEKIELKKGVISESKSKITEAPSQGNKYDFRETNWGMSKEQVKATEDKKPDIESDGMLAYEETTSGKNFVYIYFFSEDKLHTTSGSISTGEHTNKNIYIDDYEELKETLTKKYGKPTLDKVTWKNDLYKNDEQDWGTAISVGHLAYEASWETSTTKIDLSLKGADNYRIYLILVYKSKELEEWARQIKEPLKEISKTETEKPAQKTNINREKMIEIFKKEALAKWGGDYEMVNYTVQNQTQAYDWVVNLTKYPEIMARAKSKWQNDYEMVKYTYENQVEAYEWGLSQTAYPDIMVRAKQKWGGDYEMVKYEYENQVEAYKALKD
jgi:hypothetical protein